MFTSMDKALVALVMGALSLLNLIFGWEFGLSTETVTAIIAAITPVLVYFIPNKKPTGP